MTAVDKNNYQIYALIGNPISNNNKNNADKFQLDNIFQNGKINSISFKDVAAVVSTIEVIDYDHLDKKELTALVEIHQQVNSQLMKQYIVIPMRFGMIVESKDEILDLLQKAYIQFKMLLERVSGKVEYIVEIIWDKNLILQNIINNNENILALQKEVEKKGTIRGLPLKIKLGKQIFEEIESFKKNLLEYIIQNLSSEFPDFKAGKLYDVEQNKKDANLEMIMNYSFLIDKTKEKVFETLLNQTFEKYDASLKCKLIGPMPPFSFTVINLSKGNFDLIDESRKSLALGETATMKDIKKAYHNLAGKLHPDKNEYKADRFTLKETTEQMKEVVLAKDVLTAYCKQNHSELPHSSQGNDADGETKYSFQRAAVEASILVKER